MNNITRVAKVKIKQYVVTQDFYQRGKLVYVKGTRVYDITGYDYGCAADDTRLTGIQHTSVTLNDDGSYPSQTIPVGVLQEVQDA